MPTVIFSAFDYSWKQVNLSRAGRSGIYLTRKKTMELWRGMKANQEVGRTLAGREKQLPCSHGLNFCYGRAAKKYFGPLQLVWSRSLVLGPPRCGIAYPDIWRRH